MKYQERTKLVDYGSMPKLLLLDLDRTAKAPLTEQITLRRRRKNCCQ
jgi:hypothetical protein